jgi:hypothetical protein
MEDFDLKKMHVDLRNLRVLSDFYKMKHCDIMIDINSCRKNVINLENDDWHVEKITPYLTRFDTYQTKSSDDLNRTGNSNSSGS